MTNFLDVRLSAVGGGLTASVTVCQATSINDYQSLDLRQLQTRVRGQNVLLATHGFNVDRQHGIACLSNWEGLLQLPPCSAFVGIAVAGDSVWGAWAGLSPRAKDRR